MALPDIKALTFDVFGTVVEPRGSIIREGEEYWKPKGIDIDWGAFVDAWQEGYRPAIDRVRRGEAPWAVLDVLHRQILDQIVDGFGLANLDEAQRDHLNKVWHRLSPWPDSVAGLTHLKTKFILVTLSNGNASCLVNMAKHAGLPWDMVLSPDLLRNHYKPDAEVYLGAAGFLDLPPEQVMMVASHKYDLDAARSHGLRTAFITRPTEYGPNVKVDTSPEPWFDYYATDLEDLARQLGC
jgi:2-haloacid dehalogenase